MVYPVLYGSVCLLKPCPDCCRKMRRSHRSETVAENGETTATFALFCDSVDSALHCFTLYISSQHSWRRMCTQCLLSCVDYWRLSVVPLERWILSPQFEHDASSLVGNLRHLMCRHLARLVSQYSAVVSGSPLRQQVLSSCRHESADDQVQCSLQSREFGGWTRRQQQGGWFVCLWSLDSGVGDVWVGRVQLECS